MIAMSFPGRVRQDLPDTSARDPATPASSLRAGDPFPSVRARGYQRYRHWPPIPGADILPAANNARNPPEITMTARHARTMGARGSHDPDILRRERLSPEVVADGDQVRLAAQRQSMRCPGDLANFSGGIRLATAGLLNIGHQIV
jgi:hypothetical protein